MQKGTKKIFSRGNSLRLRLRSDSPQLIRNFSYAFGSYENILGMLKKKK
jgi:hypothetical protein